MLYLSYIGAVLNTERRKEEESSNKHPTGVDLHTIPSGTQLEATLHAVFTQSPTQWVWDAFPRG
jgi:hypothetical protein